MSALRALLAALVAAASLASGAAADPARETHALRLPALAERIAKLHVQATHGVLAERSRRGLAEALRDFDAALRAAARASGAEARDHHLLLGLLWEDYRAWAARPATRDNTRKLADRADEVAWIAIKAARAATASPHARDASRAAQLAQRVPRLHLMRLWDPRNRELADEIAALSAELAELIARLRSVPQNTPEVTAHLEIAEGQHRFLEHAAHEVHRPAASSRHAQDIAKTGDHILESMERVALLYAASGR